MNELESVDQLAAAGLLARIVAGSKAGIVGGTGGNESSGIVVCKDAFSIYLEEDGKWIVRLPGLGQLIIEVECASLDEAVKVVLTNYLPTTF